MIRSDYLIAAMLCAPYGVSHGAVPEQAQASSLAVPAAQAQSPYASAIVVVQCKNAVAAVLVDRGGVQYPLDLRELTPAMLMTQLAQVPADNVTQIEVKCATDTTV